MSYDREILDRKVGRNAQLFARAIARLDTPRARFPYLRILICLIEKAHPEWDPPEQGPPEQGPPEQGPPEQGRPEQGRPEQGRPEQGRPEQGRPERKCRQVAQLAGKMSGGALCEREVTRVAEVREDERRGARRSEPRGKRQLA